MRYGFYLGSLLCAWCFMLAAAMGQNWDGPPTKGLAMAACYAILACATRKEKP